MIIITRIIIITPISSCQSKDAFSKKKKNSDHFYDRLYWGHSLSLYKIQKRLSGTGVFL